MNTNLNLPLAVAALASVALAGPASLMPAHALIIGAQAPACTLADGLPAQVGAAWQTVRDCVAATPAGVTVRHDLGGDLGLLMARERERAGVPDLREREALAQAALVHALDMAGRGYVAHQDPEGRGHLYRMRLLDRRALFGATGANIAVLPAAQADAAGLYRALMGDPVNRANFTRADFTDSGIAVVEAGGAVYVVQVFAELAGELAEPLPLALDAGAVLPVDGLEPGFAFDDWTLTAPEGRTLARGLRARIAPGEAAPAPAFLDVTVSDGETRRSLRGPLSGS